MSRRPGREIYQMTTEAITFSFPASIGSVRRERVLLVEWFRDKLNHEARPDPWALVNVRRKGPQLRGAHSPHSQIGSKIAYLGQ